MQITTHCYKTNPEKEPILSLFSSRVVLAHIAVFCITDSTSCISLVDLNVIEQNLADNKKTLIDLVLSDEEKAFFSRFSYLKRQREWLGGRLAVKTALLMSKPSLVDTEALQQLTILPDTHGRPQATSISDRAISISHSSRFATGLACLHKNCGVDIQRISHKLSRVAGYFSSTAERTLLTDYFSLPPETSLAMLWAAKEALKKSILHDHPSIFSGITLQEISRGDNCYHFTCAVNNRHPAMVTIYNCSPYILATTAGDDYA